MIDTHTHLYDEAFRADGETSADAVRRAIGAGVKRMILPGCTPADLPDMYRLREEFPENIFLAAGLHPTELPEPAAVDAQLSEIENELRSNRGLYVAVGEIGMDLYWDNSRLEEQKRVFEAQCRLAAELDLPVIIHCREALNETLAVLASLPQLPRGVFHSFSGTPEDVARIRSLGDFYFGINGIVTFKKSTLPATLPHIPSDRLLLETDSPYLAPVPRRGRRNESAYLPYTAACVAEALSLTPEAIDRLTTENASRLFNI